MSDETVAETMERSEIGTPVPAEQYSNADSGVTGHAEQIQIIAARRALIRKDAPCVRCGARREDCEAERGKDPTAPPWFGCCADGAGMSPCRHVPDHRALSALFDELDRGLVRTVEQVLAARPKRSSRPFYGSILDQGEWWRRRDGEWIHLSAMTPGHRYNCAAMVLRGAAPAGMRYAASFAIDVQLHDGGEVAHSVLERTLAELEYRIAEDPAGWMRGTKLYRALTSGLTVQGDGTQPWQANGRDPVTGEPCEVPPPLKQVCMIPACGCSGEAHD